MNDESSGKGYKLEKANRYLLRASGLVPASVSAA